MKNNSVSKVSALSLAGFLIGYGALQAQCYRNSENIKDIPTKVARLEVKMESMEKSFGEFKVEIKKKQDDNTALIIEAIKNGGK